MISPLNLSKRSTHGLDTLTRGELVSPVYSKDVTIDPCNLAGWLHGATPPHPVVCVCVCEGVGVRVRMGWFSAVCLRVCVRAWACARVRVCVRAGVVSRHVLLWHVPQNSDLPQEMVPGVPPVSTSMSFAIVLWSLQRKCILRTCLRQNLPFSRCGHGGG